MSTQSFEAFAVGDTVFIPSVKRIEIPVKCPDCHGTKYWHVYITGADKRRMIECPRCKGGKDGYDFLIPKRYEHKVEIVEAKITEVKIKVGRKYQSEEIATTISYETNPHSGCLQEGRCCATREQAETVGQVLLEASIENEDKRYSEARQRDEERAGRDILAALSAHANQNYKELEAKVEKLREKMLEAISNEEGPEISKPSYGSPEISADSLASWLEELLSSADLPGFSESELHEAKCHC
jgi:hypothetical protein